MKFRAFIAALVLFSPFAYGQAKTQQKKSADPDRLGLTCKEILAMSSSEWIAKLVAMNDSIVDGNLRGIRVYGDCYDERTAHLANALVEKHKGPPPAARKTFAAFDQALKDFTALALESTKPPAVGVKEAYAGLYEKHFRYDFYVSFEQKAALATTAPPASPSVQQPAEKTAKELDPLTTAKNHFGELFGMLPDEKIHEVHAAFGKVLAATEGNNETKLAVYRYAIFVLEPPSAEPYSPPPF
ncbi:MAG TPA: hypothetical protein VEG64_02600 [Candidatus Sulfotelmatobacter sp.]|nr:hypothetical protein [Candidatus Sulfotelmatobacter sp.]